MRIIACLLYLLLVSCSSQEHTPNSMKMDMIVAESKEDRVLEKLRLYLSKGAVSDIIRLCDDQTIVQSSHLEDPQEGLANVKKYLTDFFQKNPPLTFEWTSKGDSDSKSSSFGIGTLKTEKAVFRISVLVTNQILQEIQFKKINSQ